MYSSWSRRYADKGCSQEVGFSSVADPHHVDADPYPNYHFDADPDPNYHFDADADPDPGFRIKAQNLEKVLK
jgi:hypothetical protein